jgi:uncharacterized protein YjaG (DUF416 family)
MLGRIGALFGKPSTSEETHRVVPLADYSRSLKADLKALPQRTQAAFAAACAERLFPAYAAFLDASGRDDHGVVRHAIDTAWEGARSGTIPAGDPAGLYKRCLGLIPVDGPDADQVPAHADDAIASAAYALGAAAGLADDAAGWAAECVINSLDQFLLGNEIDADEPDSERRIWEHPLVAAEVDRQTDDLRQLVGTSDWEAAVDAVRARATGVSALPVDQLDQEIP